MSVYTDPDPDLGGRNISRILRLLNGAPRISDNDRARVKNWEVAASDMKIFVSSMQKLDTEISVLTKSKGTTEAPQLLVNLETEIRQKAAARDQWRVRVLKGIVFKKMTEIEGVEEKQLEQAQALNEVENARRKAENDKSRIESLQNEVAEKTKANEHYMTVINKRVELARGLSQKFSEMTSKLREKDMEMTRKLSEKDLEMASKLQEKDEEDARKLEQKLDEKESEMAHKLEKKDLEIAKSLEEKQMLLENNQKKAEADKLQLEEAHRIECERLRLRAQRAEERLVSIRNVLQEPNQTVQEPWETSGIWVDFTSGAESEPNEVPNWSVQLETNAELQHGGDVTQTKSMEVSTPCQQDGRKRRRITYT